MDISTLLLIIISCLFILATVINRISKAKIEKQAMLRDISSAKMDFDKIDKLKNKNLSPEYLLKLQAVEQATIEAKFQATGKIGYMAFLYDRASHLPSKGFKKSIENQLVFAIRGKISELEKLSSPEDSKIVLENLPILEKASKNITAEDVDRKIKKLWEKHKRCEGVSKEDSKKLVKTH